MSYSQSYFGKELNDLTYRDIENFFIHEKDESDKIEFKSYVDTEGSNDKEKENAIIKNVCGLLNSEGGLIIWGAPIGTTKPSDPKHKVFVGDLSPVQRNIEKDTFIRRVTDSITPSPKGVNFQQLQSNTNYVYVIEVEKSNYSPHQFQSKYWMRVDGLTVTAPHHYIEALFKKITFPKLEGYLKIDNATLERQTSTLNLWFSFFVYNKSKLQNAHDLTIRIIINNGSFRDSYAASGKYKYYPSDKELRIENAKSTLFYNEPYYHTEILDFRMENNLLNQVGVSFFFGCRTSPLMVSEYLISIDKMALNGTDYDYNQNFQLIKENQYLHDKSGSLQLSEDEKLEKVLGRKPSLNR